MQNKYVLPILIAVMGLLYIFVIDTLIFKLIPMALIIYYAYTRMPAKKSASHWLILTGLFFCINGDWLLMWFIIGLSAFLTGHIFYVAGFLKAWKFSNARMLIVIPLGIYGIFIGNKVVDAIIANGDNSLVAPVVIYVFVITFMSWTAFMTGNKWAIIGSLLFLASDSILAWNKFVGDVEFSSSLIMLTYYSAQFLIAHCVATIHEKSV